MLKKLALKNSRIYLRLFMTLMTCIVLIVMLLSSLFYIKFFDLAVNQVYNYNLNNLAQTRKQVSMMVEMTKTLSFQIFADLNIAKLLYYPLPDVYDMIPAMNQLSTYRISMPFIDSVYVYNPSTETFFVSTNNQNTTIGSKLIGSHKKSEFVDSNIVDIINNLKEYKPFYPVPRHFAYDIPNSANYSCFTILCYEPFEKATGGVVVINIRENWIRDIMTSEIDSPSSDTFIIDGSGKLASNSNNEKMLTDISQRKYITLLQASPKSSGYLVEEIDGEKFFITYTEPDSLDWRYIRITPYNIIFSSIEKMKANLVTTCAIILIFSFLLAFVVSRLLSNPIDTKLMNLKKLESEQHTRNKILKQEFLSNLLLCRKSPNFQIIEKIFKEHDVQLNPAAGIFMLLLRIDNYKEFLQKYIIDDISLYKFGIGNIASELCSDLFFTEAVDMGEDRMVLLLNPKNGDLSEPELESQLEELVHSFNHSIQKFLKTSVSITVSPSGIRIENAGTIYNQMLEASYHRFFYGWGCILHSQAVMAFKEKEYTYPVHKEKQLTEAIMAYNTCTAKSIYCEIVNETIHYPFTVINFVLSHLALTVTNTFNIVYKNNQLAFQPGINTAMLNPNTVDTLDEINGWFFKLFDELKLALEEKRSMKHVNLIQNINAIIASDYANPDLCLNSIAEKLDMNPSYIGRLYKQRTLKTIPDYLAEVRMNKAKEFLQKTQYPIAKISEKIGIANSSYFYKSFKKLNGVTPADFRKNMVQE